MIWVLQCTVCVQAFVKFDNTRVNDEPNCNSITWRECDVRCERWSPARNVSRLSAAQRHSSQRTSDLVKWSFIKHKERILSIQICWPNPMLKSHVKLWPEEGYNKSETLSNMCSKTGGEKMLSVCACIGPGYCIQKGS